MTRVLGEVLLHPISLSCTLIWGLNDHIWKWTFRSWWTGKLSDVCSLVVFPLFLFTLYQAGLWLTGRKRQPTLKELLGIVSLVGLGFVSINLVPLADQTYRLLVALTQAPGLTLKDPLAMIPHVNHTPDPSDLLTLPALGVAVLIGKNHTAPHLGQRSIAAHES